MALADEEVHPTEIDRIMDIAWKRGIPEQVVKDLLLEPGSYDEYLPKSKISRLGLLYDFTKIVIADGRVDPSEAEALLAVARRYEIREEAIGDLVDDLLRSATESRPLGSMMSIVSDEPSVAPSANRDGIQGDKKNEPSRQRSSIVYRCTDGVLLTLWEDHSTVVIATSRVKGTIHRQPTSVAADSPRQVERPPESTSQGHSRQSGFHFEVAAHVLDEAIPFTVTRDLGRYRIVLNRDHAAFSLFEPLLKSSVSAADALPEGYRAVLYLLLSWGTYETSLTGPRQIRAREARIDWGRQLRKIADEFHELAA
jgi:hypothetical protein